MAYCPVFMTRQQILSQFITLL